MEKERKEIKALEELKGKTTDFEEQMEIADKIHNLKMKINGVKPGNSYVDCIGCGS